MPFRKEPWWRKLSQVSETFLAQPRTAVNIPTRAAPRDDSGLLAMDPAGSSGRVGDDSLRDARFEAFLEVASPPDLPPDIAAQIRLGLARQYDAPPVEQTALVLRSNCTVDRLRQMIYWPTKEDAELYPALIRSPPPGAPSTHPSARTQVTFLMALYLRHAKDRAFAESFVLAGGLASLVPLLVHPNLHLRGQAMETFVQFTDEALFPWHDPPRPGSSIDKAMHQRMLELAKQALVPNLTRNIRVGGDGGDDATTPEESPTFPGGSGMALRAFAFFASYLRLRHCPGNVLRLSDELLSVLRSVADDENASESDKRSDDERALAKALYEDFSRFEPADTKTIGGAPDPLRPTQTVDHPETASQSSPDALVVLGMGLDDACRVVADRTVVSRARAAKKKVAGDDEKIDDDDDDENSVLADAGEAFKKRGNVFFAKGDYCSAIELYGRAIDAPVSYGRLFDEAPRRATYHANRAAAYLRRGDAADAGAGACDVNGHLENAVLRTTSPHASEDERDRAVLASSRAHAEAALLDCDAALEMQSGNAKARFRRAVALWRLGRVAEAKRDAERLSFAARSKEDEAEASTLMRTLDTPYVCAALLCASKRDDEGEDDENSSDVSKEAETTSVRGSGGATKNGGAGEKKKKDVSLSRDASDSLAGHLFLSATLSEREEEARASFASPAAALVFGSREDAADGVAAIGGEGDELYDLD